jgi:RNA polymerase sigma-70 factor (ECF subfamily)
MTDVPHTSEVPAEFISRLTAAQFALQAYITFLVGNAEDANDILQETNQVLWREAATYDLDRPFLPWAKSVAWYQVKTFRTLQSRDRLVFDEELLERVAQSADEEADMNRMLEALENCFERLSKSQKAVIRARYFHGKEVNAIATGLRCSVGAVSMLLFRIRDKLGACVEKALNAEESHAR